MKTLKFNDFVLNENLTEFGFNHMGATGIAGGGINSDTTQPNDPQLTTNGWDRHKNNIMNSQNRLMDILRSIFDTTPAFSKKAVDLKVEKMKINRMYRNASGSVDIYLEYIFEHAPDKIYNGVFRQWGGNYKTKFVSELTETSHDKMGNTKVIGILTKSLEKWFKPLKGKYMLLQDQVGVWTALGEKIDLVAGDVVEVKRVQSTNYKPTVVLESKGESYKLSNLDYWYFNWWFEPFKTPKLKI